MYDNKNNILDNNSIKIMNVIFFDNNNANYMRMLDLW